MSDYFAPLNHSFRSALLLLMIFCASVETPSVKGQAPQSFTGFTLVRRVTDKDQDGREFLDRTETLYVSSSGDWRSVATYPNGQTVETIFLCNKGVFFSDQRNKQLVKLGNLGAGCPGPTTAKRLETDSKFVRTENVLGRLAYLHRRNVGYIEETYFAPELGPFPFKRISYLENYTLIEEPVSLTFKEPEPAQLLPVNYPITAQPVQESKLWERIEEKPDPQPPAEALSTGINGEVEVQLQVTIDESGQVIRAVIIRDVPPLGAAALEAVYRARFKPVVRDGNAVKATGLVPYLFLTH